MCRDPPQAVRQSSLPLKKPEVVDIKDFQADDIVIAYVIMLSVVKFDLTVSSVMGPTGCGTSTVRQITGSDIIILTSF